MKPFLLALSVLFCITSFAQEKDDHVKKDNFFLSTELGKTLGASALDKTYGVSFVYNRVLLKNKLGLGVGLEFIDVRTKKLGGIMPSADLRYYSRLEKSTFIPIAQVGYNFYNYQYQKVGGTGSSETGGGLGYTLGIGYSYRLTDKGSGLFGALKYRGLQYSYTDPLLPKRMTKEQLTLSIGWRF